LIEQAIAFFHESAFLFNWSAVVAAWKGILKGLDGQRVVCVSLGLLLLLAAVLKALCREVSRDGNDERSYLSH